jgi:hypothetical protein
MSSNQETVQCVVCLDPEIQRDQLAFHPCGQDPICSDCFLNYFQKKIGDAPHGTCPPLLCPVCPKQPFPPELLSSSLLDKYNSLAKSVLSLQCGSCHYRRTLMIEPIPSDSSIISNLRNFINPEHSFDSFLGDLRSFHLGQLPVNSFYVLILDQYFPSVAHSSDKDSWDIFKVILSMISNPERRANLHLRYLRARPRAYLTCCNREQCYRCKTRDTHEGKTCDEMESLHDNGFVRCSRCFVYLVKGDGCDSVTCVCGNQFSWSSEREKFESSREFQEYFPVDTDVMYARVVCETDGERLCPLLTAESWAQEHELDAMRALLGWWAKTYAPYQSQRTLLKDSIPQTSGATKACLYWEQTHSSEVQRCQRERELAINSLIGTYFPGASPQILMSWFDRDDFIATTIRSAMTDRLPRADQLFLQQSIEDYRIQYHKSLAHHPEDPFNLLTSSLPIEKPELSTKVTMNDLNNFLTGAQQFLALYGHLHAELGQLEIKIIPPEIQKGNRKNKKKHFKNPEMNRVMGSGCVLCRWSYSRSSKQFDRPFYPGVVTHYWKGLFDVTFTDGSGVEHRLGGLIFRYTLDSETSLYLPKYRCCSDQHQGTYPRWKPYFFPAMQMNKEHNELYERYCQCLHHSHQLYDHQIVQQELQHFTDRSRVYRGILPIARLLEETIFETEFASCKPQKPLALDAEGWQEAKKRNRKDKKKMDDCRRTEKMTWRDVFRGVMWKAVKDAQR